MVLAVSLAVGEGPPYHPGRERTEHGSRTARKIPEHRSRERARLRAPGAGRLAHALHRLWLASAVVKVMRLGLEKRKVDHTLTPFISNLVGWILKILVIVSVASTLGIATTSFVAILGAAGLAVGLALQGSLSNFAGGVLILIFKPFKVGDAVEMQGISGSVIRIDILHTVVLTWDNREVVLPNGAVANDKIINTNKQG